MRSLHDRRPLRLRSLSAAALLLCGPSALLLVGRENVSPAPDVEVKVLHRIPLAPRDAKDNVEAPSIAVDRSGRLYVAWASKTGDAERTVFLASAGADGSFGVPTVLAKCGIYRTAGKGGHGHERRATPHVIASGEKVEVAWSEALADGSGMRMVLASSADGGRTFDTPQPVHRGAGANPTFTGAARSRDGAMAISWLGGGTIQMPFAAFRLPGSECFEPERRVAEGQVGIGVCPCCPTAVALDRWGTLYVAYRDIASGYRDIAICRRRPGAPGFESPQYVVPTTTWKIDGCPHDGPSLALAGDKLHVVWMDARDGVPRCWHATSPVDKFGTFHAEPLGEPSSRSQGNAKLLADSNGRVHAVWEEALQAGDNAGRAILYAELTSGTKPMAIAPAPGAVQTRPALACGPTGDIHVVWNERRDAEKSVVVARLGKSPGRSSALREVKTRATGERFTALLQQAGFTPVDSRPATDLLLEDVGGGPSLNLAELRGKLMILAFWGTSCPHCLGELAQLEGLSDRLKGAGVAVVPVCVDEDDPDAICKAARPHAKNLPLYVEPAGRAQAAYDVQILPATWVIDASDHLVCQRIGAIDWSSAPVRELINVLVARGASRGNQKR